jgi:hypothetical protein
MVIAEDPIKYLGENLWQKYYQEGVKNVNIMHYFTK